MYCIRRRKDKSSREHFPRSALSIAVDALNAFLTCSYQLRLPYNPLMAGNIRHTAESREGQPAAFGQYDRVILKGGLAAQIVEVLSGGDMYVADVSAAGGWEDDDTVFVSPGEIERKA